MLKKTFLKKLETSLSPLGEEKVSKIIKKYDKIIDEEVNKGQDEKDVVASLGSVDLISKLYLDDKDDVKIEEKNAEKKTASNSPIDNILDGILDFVDDTFKKVDRDLAKRILLILCFIFIGFLAVSLIQIPFRIINYTGRNILTYFFDNFYFYGAVGSLWSFGLGICFFILIVWLIAKYTNRIVNHYTGSERNDAPKTETIKKEEVREANRNDDTSVFDVIFIILKVFAIILTIPLLTMIAGLVITLFILIALIINGIVLYGPIIIILGLIMFVSVIVSLIFDVIFKGGVK